MSEEDREDTTIYKVVVNHEEQYSIWPEYKENPLGWRMKGKPDSKPSAWLILARSGRICGHSVCARKWRKPPHKNQHSIMAPQNNPWIICRHPQPHAVMRLLCFPYAGGGGFSVS